MSNEPNILDNKFLVAELLSTDGEVELRLLRLGSAYRYIYNLTSGFKNHPIDCGFTESEWSSEYREITSTIDNIPEYDMKYPYHTGLLRDLLAKAPITFPE